MVATNLQFVISAVSAKYSKAKLHKMRYAYTILEFFLILDVFLYQQNSDYFTNFL